MHINKCAVNATTLCLFGDNNVMIILMLFLTIIYPLKCSAYRLNRGSCVLFSLCFSSQFSSSNHAGYFNNHCHAVAKSLQISEVA